MASCKDCLHVDVCEDITRHKLSPSRAAEILPILREHGKTCELFKDRSRFVEVPCKVGDTVYVIEDIAGEKKIIQDTVETIGIGYYADGINIYQFDGIKTDGYFSDFGKTVFLTREEAEQALKERERNANNKNDT